MNRSSFSFPIYLLCETFLTGTTTVDVKSGPVNIKSPLHFLFFCPRSTLLLPNAPYIIKYQIIRDAEHLLELYMNVVVRKPRVGTVLD
ncbi:hypothetical protein DFS33DRAFT_235929 [Desarmillaria ectypa]|nr:hypothetical protein DFS33DRAFT_235929 [Desarmillaria ectypa]